MIFQFHTPQGITEVDSLTVTDNELAFINMTREEFNMFLASQPRDLPAEIDELKVFLGINSLPPPGPVDIGVEAIDRNETASGNTTIEGSNPSSISGLIISIDIWAATNMAGLMVGSFYTTNGNTLKCRDSEAIAGTITAGSKVTKAVSIAVEIGDYIGCYFDTGSVDISTNTGDFYWYLSGRHIDPNDEETYNSASPRRLSLGGYIG